MGAFRKIAIAVLVLSFFVFVAFFGRLPALRATPIGFLHRCIWIHIPKAARVSDTALTGGRLTRNSSRLANYLFHQKNPIVLLFFLTLLTSGSSIFVYTAWSRIPSTPHHILIPLLLPLPYIFTYLSVTARSHLITSSNHALHLSSYPFDHTLYKPHTICYTCNFEKPARSKHCSLCKHCVARADHHCVWVNNCLGATNYRWFIGLLSSLSVVLSYGALLSYKLVSASINAAAGRRTPTSHGWLGWSRTSLDRLSYAIQLDVNVAAVGLLAALTAPLAFCLLVYHVYLAWAGMTTNETGKWADLKDDAEDGVLWKRQRRVQLSTPAVFQNGSAQSPFYSNEKAHRVLPSRPVTVWPVVSDQAIVTAEDMPEDDDRDGEYADREWLHCRSLDELNNLYDAGLWFNVKDALNIR